MHSDCNSYCFCWYYLFIYLNILNFNFNWIWTSADNHILIDAFYPLIECSLTINVCMPLSFFSFLFCLDVVLDLLSKITAQSLNDDLDSGALVAFGGKPHWTCSAWTDRSNFCTSWNSKNQVFADAIFRYWCEFGLFQDVKHSDIQVAD